MVQSLPKKTSNNYISTYRSHQGFIKSSLESGNSHEIQKNLPNFFFLIFMIFICLEVKLIPTCHFDSIYVHHFKKMILGLSTFCHIDMNSKWFI